jgi:nucleoside-diphosphate-sugar epimerase
VNSSWQRCLDIAVQRGRAATAQRGKVTRHSNFVHSLVCAAMSRPAVLITGGTGYLAQHTMQALLKAEGARVAFTYRTSAPSCDALAFQLDLLTASVEDIATILRDFMPDVVLHLAASSGLGACEKDPESAFAVNAVRDLCSRCSTLHHDSTVNSTLNGADFTARSFSVHFLNVACNTMQPRALLDALQLVVSQCLVVYISTDQVYGQHEPAADALFTEASTPAPLNVYGKSKLAFETLLQQSSLPFIILRSSNIIGPPAPYTQTGKFLQWLEGQLTASSSIITLHSDELRNFVYVKDITAALLAIVAQATAAEPAPQLELRAVYNMGGPAALSRAQLGQLLSAVLGSAVHAQIAAAPRASSPWPSPLDLSMSSDKLWSALQLTATPLHSCITAAGGVK